MSAEDRIRSLLRDSLSRDELQLRGEVMPFAGSDAEKKNKLRKLIGRALHAIAAPIDSGWLFETTHHKMLYRRLQRACLIAAGASREQQANLDRLRRTIDGLHPVRRHRIHQAGDWSARR